MNSLYLENSTMGSLFQFFSRYFSTATRPTQFLLTWLVISVDDTTVPKFGKKFDAVSLLHDHACHMGKTYVNGHCFVSLTLSVPVLSPREGKRRSFGIWRFLSGTGCGRKKGLRSS